MFQKLGKRSVSKKLLVFLTLERKTMPSYTKGKSLFMDSFFDCVDSWILDVLDNPHTILYGTYR